MAIARIKEVPFDSKFFTPEIRADVDYIYDFHHPKDDTIGGSSEVFRSNEVQVTQLGVGGDFHYDNVRARLMTQFGMYSQTTPRNDASPSRGQWKLDNAYRYISEAYGGYHFNALHGINVDAGIFMSYIGLFSYYNFDNWAYQPSYVSSNTPWFFNGVRVQIFPNEHLKIEPWFINGWQSYGRFNNRPGIGGQIHWRPTGWLSIARQPIRAWARMRWAIPAAFAITPTTASRSSTTTNPRTFIDKAAFSLTGDLGCEHGGGVSCAGDSAKGPKQSFLGFMVYNRIWLHKDLYGITAGRREDQQPRTLPGAAAADQWRDCGFGTPYFTENPGDPYKAWDVSATSTTCRASTSRSAWEYNHRAANVPYFSGSGGVTPPGGNQGAPARLVQGWSPDLAKNENRMNFAILVKF